MEQLVPCVLAQVESSCTRHVRCHSPSEPFVYRSDPTLMAAGINQQTGISTVHCCASVVGARELSGSVADSATTGSCKNGIGEILHGQPCCLSKVGLIYRILAMATKRPNEFPLCQFVVSARSVSTNDHIERPRSAPQLWIRTDALPCGVGRIVWHRCHNAQGAHFKQ